ncbi:MAG: Tn3 family transposase [Pseudonocardiaceae bacterium]
MVGARYAANDAAAHDIVQAIERNIDTMFAGLEAGLTRHTSDGRLDLWNTRYLDAALTQLRAQGYAIRDEDVARLSPFAHAHLNVTGTYSFVLPDLAGDLRPLRDGDDDDLT